MPKLSFAKHHRVTLDEAKARVRQLVEDFAREHSRIVSEVKYSADGTAATATGKGFTGRFEVNENEVNVEVDLSFLATPFKGRIEDGVSKRLHDAFPETA